MSIINSILPVYASDISGVCSALYELGGMTVVHDASGCRSTYTTHDEPRWEESPSKVYFSALTERDIMRGSDERFIDGVASTALRQHPAFICICASPVAVMTGVDMDACAREIERRTGIWTFHAATTGTRPYTYGVDAALLEIVKKYTFPLPIRPGGANIIGATPLDFWGRQVIEGIRREVTDMGFDVLCCMAMGDTLDDIARAGAAEVSLVISSGGLSAARYLYDTCGIPYVCGVPTGGRLSEEIRSLLLRRDGSIRAEGISAVTVGDTIAIGERITAMSAARSYTLETGKPAKAICTVGYEGYRPPSEEELRRVLSRAGKIIGDPLYRYICPDRAFVSKPHFAFSGRMYFGSGETSSKSRPRRHKVRLKKSL